MDGNSNWRHVPAPLIEEHTGERAGGIADGSETVPARTAGADDHFPESCRRVVAERIAVGIVGAAGGGAVIAPGIVEHDAVGDYLNVGVDIESVPRGIAPAECINARLESDRPGAGDLNGSVDAGRQTCSDRALDVDDDVLRRGKSRAAVAWVNGIDSIGGSRGWQVHQRIAKGQLTCQQALDSRRRVHTTH